MAEYIPPPDDGFAEGGIRDPGEEVVASVDETGPPHPKAKRSLSVQCSADGCTDEEAKLFAQGGSLFSAEHSYSLDSGLKQLTIGNKIEELRKEFDEKIKHLEDSLSAKTCQLDIITAEKRELAEKLEAEKSEKKEKVEELEKEKVKLERKIESLENEVKELKNELGRFVNQSKGLEEQILKMQQNKSGDTPEIPVPMQQLFEGMCKLFQQHLPDSGQFPPISSLQQAIQKASGVKEDYKNGRGSVNNGMPNVEVGGNRHTLSAQLVEDNNTSKSDAIDATSPSEALVESNNTKS